MPAQELSPQQIETLKQKLIADQEHYKKIVSEQFSKIPNPENARSSVEILGAEQVKASTSLLLGNTGESGEIDSASQQAYEATLDCLIAYLDVMYRLNLIDSLDDISCILYHYTIRVADEYQYTNQKKEET